MILRAAQRRGVLSTSSFSSAHDELSAEIGEDATAQHVKVAFVITFVSLPR